MRVAVLGAGGQLGTDLLRMMGAEWDLIGLPHSVVDVRQQDAVHEILAVRRPDVVINAAAFVRVDECEDQVETAMATNAAGALHVARACRALGAIVVHVSTDYVFDGRKSAPYTEEDAPAPINVYGLSKWAGECAVRAYLPEHYVVRVAGLFGAAGSSGKGGNFIETVVRKASAAEPLRIVDDQRMSPTYTRDAATVIAQIVDRRLPFGTYHVANGGECTWYEFAVTALTEVGLRANIEPTTSADWNARARRPARSSLVSARLPALGVPPLRPWRQALSAYLREKGHLTQ